MKLPSSVLEAIIVLESRFGHAGSEPDVIKKYFEVHANVARCDGCY